MALGDSWWSTIAVVPCLERLQGTERRRPADHLEVEGAVEAPPDLVEDLLEAVGVRGGAGMPRASVE